MHAGITFFVAKKILRGAHNNTTLAKIVMASSAWICSKCTFVDEGSKPWPCLMCQAPYSKCKPVDSVPAPYAAPPDVAYVAPAKPAAVVTLSASAVVPVVASTVPAKPACIPQPARSSGIVIDIVVIAAGYLGCQCREHKVCCGKVVDVDIVVHLCRKEILVPDILSGKDKMREETAITVNWVMDRFDCCHLRFLPHPYVPDAVVYDGVLGQVIAVFGKDDPSCAISNEKT